MLGSIQLHGLTPRIAVAGIFTTGSVETWRASAHATYRDTTLIQATAAPTAVPGDEVRSQLWRDIEHAAHLLPTQGPISVFVHHNTLHAFEEQPFEKAVLDGFRVFSSEPYWSEERFREELAANRITRDDLVAVLLDDLGDDADQLVGFMGTRFQLRLAMLEQPLGIGTAAELHWLLSETSALEQVSTYTPAHVRHRLIEQTRQWVARENQAGRQQNRAGETLLPEFDQLFPGQQTESWTDEQWESAALHLLWRICMKLVRSAPSPALPIVTPRRHRDLLLKATGQDSDALVHEILIRITSAYLDQGYASWSLPARSHGLWYAFCELFADARPAERWLQGLPEELRRLRAARIDGLASIAESLSVLGVSDVERHDYIVESLLALRGWGGMIWQMETNAEWTPLPAPQGSLVDYLAIQLLLERFALTDVWNAAIAQGMLLPPALPVRSLLPVAGQPSPAAHMIDFREALRNHLSAANALSDEQRAYPLFQLAQVRGWSPLELEQLNIHEWSRLIGEVEAFPDLERRRIFQLAYERHYRERALGAISAHQATVALATQATVTPSFQVITCIDDREESLRRHLEELEPACQTFGAAGFFGVAMYYRGVSEAHFRPLCPVVIKPQHYVIEEVAYSLSASSRYRREAMRMFGQASHGWHVASRSLWAGALTSLVGSFASVPMIARILFPRLTARWRHRFGSLLRPPPVTGLTLTRIADPPAAEDDHLGYSIGEMSQIVERLLRDIGLTDQFAPIVLLLGHGSSSLNNPHESAYNCGACSGGRGGPNARAFARMANREDVRQMLHDRGLVIPPHTIFIGGYHNTCDEDVVYFDLDRLPRPTRQGFERMRAIIDQARAVNAHERCRRFESAPLWQTNEEALEHVEARAEDLSQARPEYNHATNAMCIVGRRSRTRGLFLDRRAFLASYDPTQDTEGSPILTRILQAVVPVCAGISLEYYFSTVDINGYGCGSKLPHNIVSLLGVMEGAASDLRTGLSQQMTEIHEPMRLLFLLETTPQKFDAILARNPPINQLVSRRWVQIAVLDPDSETVRHLVDGQWRVVPKLTDLPQVAASSDWYQGQRGHLGFASVGPWFTGKGPRREVA